MGYNSVADIIGLSSFA